MKGKQLLILIVASAVLGGAGFMLSRQDASRMTNSKLGMGKPVLGGLDINSVAGIRIRTGTNQLNVVRDSDTWVVRERGSYPAGFSSISDFLRKLDGLKVTRPVEVGPSRLPALDLVPPGQGDGTQLELLGSDGKSIRSLLLGKTHSRGGEDSTAPFGEGGMANGRYVQVESDPKQIVLVSDPLSSASTRAEDWLDKTFFKVELPRRIEITRPDESTGFVLSRTNEFSEWTWEDAAADEKLDVSKTSLFGSILSSPTFTDVIIEPDAARLGLDKPSVARIETTKGFVYEVLIGKPQANEDYPVRVRVVGEWPRQRIAVPDEKPEDKERLDKEFQTELAGKEEKLRSEEKFGKWTYLVSRWSIEPALKTRKDLMAGAATEASATPGENPFGSPALPSLPLPPGE